MRKLKYLAGVVLLSLTLVTGSVALAEGAAAKTQTTTAVGGQVGCNYTPHRIHCWNYTPYIVRVHLRIVTSNGTYYRNFNITGTYYNLRSGPYIYRVIIRWHYA